MNQSILSIPPARTASPVVRDPAIGGTVEANVYYLVPPLGRHSVTVVPPGTGQTKRTDDDYALTPVTIHDGRAARRPATLDGEGFALGRQASAVADFSDDDEIRSVYYPEMAQLVKRATGAREVVVFDHNIRIDGGARTENSRVPVRVVHNDYTERSGPQRVRDLVDGPRAKSLLKGRFAIVNVWRSIDGTVQTAPLGVIDAGSVRPSDLVPTDLIYPDRVGEIYEVAGNAAHRWSYFPRMTEEEVLFIKGYDSRPDVARFTPHSAFDDPTSPAAAPPRHSIEIRSLVFY